MTRVTAAKGPLDRFRAGERIEGLSVSRGFAYSLDPSVPYLATAIHSGHHVDAALLPWMEIDERDRLFEEDPATDRLIHDCGSAIWGLDSRAEYDLNRPPAEAVPLSPDVFWGTRVFRARPPDEILSLSLEKHREFHEFLLGAVGALLDRFGRCVVYDIHSYNLSRQVSKGIVHPPLFNLGTALLNRDRWASAIEAWLDRLGGIVVPGIPTTVAENKVFSGRGELCRRLTAWDPRVLVLPTETAKVYMDERSGEEFPEIIEALGSSLCLAIREHGGRGAE